MKESTPELLAAAEKYNSIRLKEICIVAMLKNLAVENILQTLEVADIYSIPYLKKAALHFFSAHRQIIKNIDGFNGM